MKKTSLELNVNMKNGVGICLFFLDHRKIPPQETLLQYNKIRQEGEILFDVRIGDFNRVVILKVGDKHWYLSAAADKNGQLYEELYFYECTADDVPSYIEEVHKKIEKWTGGK